MRCYRALKKTKALRNIVFVHIRENKISKHSVNENKEDRWGWKEKEKQDNRRVLAVIQRSQACTPEKAHAWEFEWRTGKSWHA